MLQMQVQLQLLMSPQWWLHLLPLLLLLAMINIELQVK